MIESLFNTLSEMLYGNMYLAFASAFLWGILSVILSPCHIASIPLIVGFIGNQGVGKLSKNAVISSLYSAGILLSLVIIGFVTILLGRIAGDLGSIPNIIVSALMIVIGLYLAGVIRLKFLDNVCKVPSLKKRGLFAAFSLGLIIGLAVGPCTFAYLAPVLGISFSLAQTNLIFAVLLVSMYALGHCLVIIAGGTFIPALQSFLNWSEKSKGLVIVKKVCGIIVILAGAYLLFNTLKPL